MITIYNENRKLLNEMKADCFKCSGLCCTALFFSKMDGFPENKPSGKSCMNLQKDFLCKIHDSLVQYKMKGCIGYDCFGAGQYVTQSIYKNNTWQDNKEKSQEIFDVFVVVFHLYQIRYFLLEANSLISSKKFRTEIEKYIDQNIRICNQSPSKILSFNLDEYRENANKVLKKASLSLRELLNSDKKRFHITFLVKTLVIKI